MTVIIAAIVFYAVIYAIAFGRGIKAGRDMERERRSKK
jgi:cbb3-type cytochrome oxidase subunit 3